MFTWGNGPLPPRSHSVLLDTPVAWERSQECTENSPGFLVKLSAESGPLNVCGGGSDLQVKMLLFGKGLV